jgi:hypothetical protein
MIVSHSGQFGGFVPYPFDAAAVSCDAMSDSPALEMSCRPAQAISSGRIHARCRGRRRRVPVPAAHRRRVWLRASIALLPTYGAAFASAIGSYGYLARRVTPTKSAALHVRVPQEAG